MEYIMRFIFELLCSLSDAIISGFLLSVGQKNFANVQDV